MLLGLGLEEWESLGFMEMRRTQREWQVQSNREWDVGCGSLKMQGGGGRRRRGRKWPHGICWGLVIASLSGQTVNCRTVPVLRV